MNRAEFEKMVMEIDPVNYEYILRDYETNRHLEWLEKNRKKYTDEHVSFMEKNILKSVSEYNGTHLTPANAKVGDGVTINLWSDRHAATITKVTKTTVTVQRDTATLNPDFKPDFIIGGFAAHCTNQSEQSYTYERDEKGEVITIHWSDKYQRYGRPGNVTLSKGRHEFYDYNF